MIVECKFSFEIMGFWFRSDIKKPCSVNNNMKRNEEKWERIPIKLHARDILIVQYESD